MENNGCLTIGLVGAGGDGVALLGSLLQRLTAAVGFEGQMAKYYGAQIRGGGSAIKLNVAAEGGRAPSDEVDVLVCFAWDQYAGFGHELATSPSTLVLAETPPPEGCGVAGTVRLVPFGCVAEGTTGDRRNKNVVALGLLAALVGVNFAAAGGVIGTDVKFRVVRESFVAFRHGYDVVVEDVSLERTLAAPTDPAPRRVIAGNLMVVEAALAAGCRACFFYPITPASEISEVMGKRLAATGGAYRQAEDEIAAIMGGIGASLAGAKTIVATSGPGLSLMSEALSFAVGAEIPLVIVDVQRGGPSTGVPTRTEQGDLFHAVYGGHGDAPRVVLAPHGLKSAWRLTRDAFNIAETFQTPVIVLSDQQLGQSTYAFDGDFMDWDYLVAERLKPSPGGGKYLRYEDTPDGVSPMANFGDQGFTYQASGLSHRADGSHASSFEVLEAWHAKIARKLEPLSRACGFTWFRGSTSCTDRVLTWGSSAQAVVAAVEASGLADRIAVCVPEMISPLPCDVERFVAGAERLLVVELNHGAQFLRHLRATIDVPRATSSYCRSGARPFGTQEIVEAIRRVFGGEESKS